MDNQHHHTIPTTTVYLKIYHGSYHILLCEEIMSINNPYVWDVERLQRREQAAGGFHSMWIENWGLPRPQANLLLGLVELYSIQ